MIFYIRLTTNTKKVKVYFQFIFVSKNVKKCSYQKHWFWEFVYSKYFENKYFESIFLLFLMVISIFHDYSMIFVEMKNNKKWFVSCILYLSWKFEIMWKICRNKSCLCYNSLQLICWAFFVGSQILMENLKSRFSALRVTTIPFSGLEGEAQKSLLCLLSLLIQLLANIFFQKPNMHCTIRKFSIPIFHSYKVTLFRQEETKIVVPGLFMLSKYSFKNSSCLDYRENVFLA